MINTLEILEKFYALEKENIKQITTDKRQFELNVRAEYKTDFLSGRIEFIKKHLSFIDKKVFKYVKSFSYVLCTDLYMFDKFYFFNNPILDTPIVFTKELYYEVVENYIKYQIEYLKNDLLERPITCNSTCKLTNLTFEWQLECKQELLGFLKELLLNNKK